jgi:hypothetical protein
MMWEADTSEVKRNNVYVPGQREGIKGFNIPKIWRSVYDSSTVQAGGAKSVHFI